MRMSIPAPLEQNVLKHSLNHANVSQGYLQYDRTDRYL